MTRLYLDTSVALHAVVPGGDPQAARWVRRASAGDELWSSTLLRLELTRVLRRERRDPDLAAPLLDRMRLMRLDDDVLQVAASLEPHVKSFDSLHLATCLMLGVTTMVSHDAGLLSAARALALDTVDPLD